jgi:hypothetical protein
MTDLITTREELNKKLTESVDNVYQCGVNLAEAERKYRVAVTKKTLELRYANEKVTIIELLVSGDEDIAKLRFERDVASAKYNSVKDTINMCKLQLKMVDMEIQREWNNPNGGRFV